ncbi:cytochrome b [Sphingobium sp. EM0848]|uniref:cytochrome b n=1 Tax=Sphingobium sp. EM0848 TaxID=2743473 RepID=UPI001C3FB0DA|nr:cytochrome b [Sphingobium sp. EM0848]
MKMRAESFAVSAQRYSTGAIILHWVIAAFIVWNLVLGFRMHGAKGLEQFNLFQLHKSVGLVVLVLSMLRLIWRLVHRPPPLPEAMHGWERLLAQSAHIGLYGIMIGLPLSGWVVVSTSTLNIPTLLFHILPWPHVPWLHELPPVAKASVNTGFANLHVMLVWGTMLLLMLHIGGALKHRFVDRDGVLERMLPFIGRVSRNEGFDE